MSAEQRRSIASQIDDLGRRLHRAHQAADAENLKCGRCTHELNRLRNVTPTSLDGKLIQTRSLSLSVI